MKMEGIIRKSKVKSQKSKVKSQKSKVKSQKSKVKSQKSKVKSQKSKVKSQKSYKSGQLISQNSFMQEEKFIMFRNRLVKVLRHLGKQAKRLNISCYRGYDHDLPEFPFCIEIYEDKLYVAEYKRQHRMTGEEHNDWIKKSLEVIREV